MNTLKKYLFDNLHTKQIILKNAFWLSLSEFFIRGSSLFLVILIARFSWVESFGKFSFAMTFIQIVAVISDMWLSSLIIKDISRENQKIHLYIYHGIYLKIASSLAIGILLYPLILAVWLEKDLVLLYAASLYVILASFVSTLRSVYKAFERNEYDTKLQFINGVLLVFLVGFLVVRHSSLEVIFLGYAFVSFLVLIFYISSFKKLYIAKKMRFDMNIIKGMVYDSGLFLLSSLCVYIYYFIDTILLYFMKWEHEVWIYSASYKILTLLIAPIGIYITAIFPTLSKSFKEKTISKEIREILINNVKNIFFASVCILLILLFSSKYIILALYGANYIESVYVLQLLLVSWFLLINYSIFAISLQSFDEQKPYFYATFAGMVINVVLNLLLIPRYSVVWSAVATIITELSVWIIICYAFWTQIHRTYFKN